MDQQTALALAERAALRAMALAAKNQATIDELVQVNQNLTLTRSKRHDNPVLPVH